MNIDKVEIIRRVAELDKLVIAHPAFSNVIRSINDCILKSEVYREPVGCLLLAKGGMGKSTVCHTVLSQMKSSIKRVGAVEKTIVPAFYSEIPSPATVKGVAASMLKDLGAVSPFSGTTIQMKARLCTLLAAAETKLVFLDETHNLFRRGNRSTAVNSEVCAWIIGMVNEAKISFCLVGLPDFAAHLSADSQLTRRFPLHLHLKPLLPGDQSQPGALVPFFAQFMRETSARLSLKSIPDLNYLFLSTQVYAATGGIPAFIISLIKEAVLNALSSGHDNISLDDFAIAWDRGLISESSLVKDNPFRMSQGALAGALRRSI